MEMKYKSNHLLISYKLDTETLHLHLTEMERYT